MTVCLSADALSFDAVTRYLNPIEANVARLYHYQKFNTDWLTATLRERKVFCSDLTALNDPWDCKPWFDHEPMAKDPAELEAMLDFFRNTKAGADPANAGVRNLWERRVRTDPGELEKTVRQLSDILAVEFAKRRIYCLTPDPCSTLMWSHYADKHHGICLEFYVGNDLFLTAKKVLYRSTYPKWVPQAMEQIRLDMILTKSADWEYEQEFRLIGTPEGSGHPLKLAGDFLRLPARALESVIIGCSATDETCAAVSNIVNTHAPEIRVKRAARAPNQYQLTIAG